MSYAFLSSSLQKSTRGSSVPSSLRHRMLADLSNTGDAPPWSLSVSAALGANHFLGTGTTDPGFHAAMTTGAATVARGDSGDRECSGTSSSAPSSSSRSAARPPRLSSRSPRSQQSEAFGSPGPGDNRAAAAPGPLKELCLLQKTSRARGPQDEPFLDQYPMCRLRFVAHSPTEPPRLDSATAHERPARRRAPPPGQPERPCRPACWAGCSIPGHLGRGVCRYHCPQRRVLRIVHRQRIVSATDRGQNETPARRTIR